MYEPFNKTVINDIITAGKAILFTDKFCIINAFLVAFDVDFILRNESPDFCIYGIALFCHHSQRCIIIGLREVKSKIYSFPPPELQIFVCTAQPDIVNIYIPLNAKPLVEYVKVLTEEILSCILVKDRILTFFDEVV